MATKNRGISPDLLIHPGETISDLLEERGITQKELASRAGVSEAFLSDVIHGRKDISKGLAKGLEYALNVPGSFWLNLQADYDAELLSLKEVDSVDDDERKVFADIREVVEYLIRQKVIASGETQEETILSLRKVFRVSSLTLLRRIVPSGAFRMSNKVAVNPDVLGAWLSLSKFYEAGGRPLPGFVPERTGELVSSLKSIMLKGRGGIEKSLRSLFNGYGIDFSIIPFFRGAPVHGYISLKDDGVYRMVLTLRGRTADIFWFSLFHELGHIVNGDILKQGDYIDAGILGEEKREKAADVFASGALLEKESYHQFVDEKDYSYRAISAYASTQGVPPYVVIGRLQKEGIIPWEWYRKYIPAYKWAEV